MKPLQFEVKETGQVDQEKLNEILRALGPEIERICQALGQKYDTPYAFMNLPTDQHMHERVQQVAEQKRALSPCILIIVGVGGSNLGTLAVQEAVYGRLYNDLDPPVRVYYADTVDTDRIKSILTVVERCLKEGKQIIVNVISKSGRTTETIANFELFLQLLRSHRPDTYADYIVATTDKDSPLWQLATQQTWTTLEIPKKVGGRFSVLSPVGLFPLALLGIDIKELSRGAASIRDRCEQSGTDNYAALGAVWQYVLFRKRYTLHNIFLFASDFFSLGRWWRQLYAESLGKEEDIEGVWRPEGIMPLVSMGSTDLHSVGQLYLSKILSIMTTFVSVEKERFVLQLPDYEQEFEKMVPNMQGKKLVSIMEAINRGVSRAYTRRELPFAKITLAEKSAYCIGEFLQLKMTETVYLASLLRVNPFDQPHVELYKKETREILGL